MIARLMVRAALLGAAALAPAVCSEPSGSEFGIALVTIGPGPTLPERFGHSALLIRDKATGARSLIGLAGISDARVPQFLRRHSLHYEVHDLEPAHSVHHVLRRNRSIRIQTLNLDDARTLDLVDEIARRVRFGETVEYDFWDTNCTTWIRDLIDDVADGQLRESLTGSIAARTRRDELRRALLPANVWLAAAADIAAGSTLDRETSAFEALNLPDNLAHGLTSAVVDGAPLVLLDRQIDPGARPFSENPPRRSVLAHAVLGLMLAGGILVLKRRGKWRWTRGLLVRAPAFAFGVFGTLLCYLTLNTDIRSYGGNLNILVFSPIWLIPALAPTFGPALRARAITFVAGLGTLQTLAAGIWLLADGPQANGAWAAMALPVQLAILSSLRRERVAVGQSAA